MASNSWLVCDVNNLGAKNFFALPAMVHKGQRTEVIFGVLRDLLTLRQRFATDNLVCCFDHGPSLRKKVLPGYKASREQTKAFLLKTGRDWRDLTSQLDILREVVLSACGLFNVFAESGYEADDIIASVCKSSLKGGDAVMVSSDKDLYQLLTDRVVQYNMSKETTYTEEMFCGDWGLKPGRWAEVKAIAGCEGDDIPGTHGVAEKTAAKYLRGDIPPGHKAYGLITCGDARGKQKTNLPLVTLPYPGTPRYKLTPDRFDFRKWELVAKKYGIKTLRE